MRTFFTVALAVLFAVVAVGQAWAFSCPNLVKGANEAIAAAEPKAGMGDDRQKARNAGMVEEAKALSKAAEADNTPVGSTRGPRRRPGPRVARRAGEVARLRDRPVGHPPWPPDTTAPARRRGRCYVRAGSRCRGASPRPRPPDASTRRPAAR